jgi:uncharacterized protein Smg (DUF494 family)
VPQGFRILHEKEKAKIDADAIRYLLKLEQKKRLTPIMREFILSQVMKLDVPTVSLEQLKWILSMAKLNHENKEDTLEMLIYDLLNDTDEKKFSPILH